MQPTKAAAAARMIRCFFIVVLLGFLSVSLTNFAAAATFVPRISALATPAKLWRNAPALWMRERTSICKPHLKRGEALHLAHASRRAVGKATTTNIVFTPKNCVLIERKPSHGIDVAKPLSMSYVPVSLAGKNGGMNEGTNGSSALTTFVERESRWRPAASRQHRQRTKSSPADHADGFSIIVHCHLCWDWVWQRPQQFLSRLSAKHKILFVETVGPDPQLAAPYARFRLLDGFPNITLLRLQFPTRMWNDGAFVDRERRRLVQQALKSELLAGHFDHPVQWFYDPMAVTAFAGHMNEIATVYDCMDELSKFKGAPPEIVARERELLAKADVVFTGGRKMWESKSRFNDNCHFYGCGVDVAHFGTAREEATSIPDDLLAIESRRNFASGNEASPSPLNGERAGVTSVDRESLSSTTPHPQSLSPLRGEGSRKILGFFGVVDERMDYELAAKLADSNPNWSVVIIGPTIKIDPASLPQRANLHWLGGREYKDLPAYCKGFDVCLMPFAMNEHTEFINPTKSLEYMATGRVVVSSAVPDVVSNFGSVVKVARNHDEFIKLCEEAVNAPDQDAIERGLKMASENSWESIVNKLDGHIRDVLVRTN
jgi:glycosyltransferase involved in cell wall biosynthesis